MKLGIQSSLSFGSGSSFMALCALGLCVACGGSAADPQGDSSAGATTSSAGGKSSVSSGSGGTSAQLVSTATADDSCDHAKEGGSCHTANATCGHCSTDRCTWCPLLRCEGGQWVGIEAAPDPACSTTGTTRVSQTGGGANLGTGGTSTTHVGNGGTRALGGSSGSTRVGGGGTPAAGGSTTSTWGMPSYDFSRAPECGTVVSSELPSECEKAGCSSGEYCLLKDGKISCQMWTTYCAESLTCECLLTACDICHGTCIHTEDESPRRYAFRCNGTGGGSGSSSAHAGSSALGQPWR